MSSQNEASVLEQTTALGKELEGKYLTFLLAHEEYGVGILKVREIIALQDITPIPRMPDYIRGVINLRGKIIPVVDLRIKLGMNAPEFDAHTCIVVLDVLNDADGTDAQIGCIVDTVSEVLFIAADEVDPPPKFASTINIDFIVGLGKIDERSKVVALLDIDKVLCAQEVSEITAHGQQVESTAT